MAGFLKGLFSGKSGKEAAGEDAPMQAAPHREMTELSKLSEKYYRMGKEYQLKGDLERARLYLDRASTIYSNFEQVFDECRTFMYDCDEQIGMLEEEDLLYNEVLEQVEEKAEELTNQQSYLWGILSFARMQKIFEKLSGCEDCELLKEMGRVLDVLCHGVEQMLTAEELEYLQNFVSRLYDVDNSEAYVRESNRAVLENGRTLQVFDLNGNSTLTCLDLFLDKCACILESGFHMADFGEPAELDFIPGTLMIDFYLRNEEGDPHEIPQLQAETARIWSDFEFVKSGPDIQKTLERIRSYRELDILNG